MTVDTRCACVCTKVSGIIGTAERNRIGPVCDFMYFIAISNKHKYVHQILCGTEKEIFNKLMLKQKKKVILNYQHLWGPNI